MSFPYAKKVTSEFFFFVGLLFKAQPNKRMSFSKNPFSEFNLMGNSLLF